MVTEKTCFKCGKTLPLEAFYKHKAMADGHLNKCICCVKAYEKERRRGPIGEKIREYDRNRGNRQGYEYTKMYREENKDRYAAHTAVNNALKRGKIEKTACFSCGNENVEAHHPDYSSPLEVIWLCPVCHKRTHADAKETK